MTTTITDAIRSAAPPPAAPAATDPLTLRNELFDELTALGFPKIEVAALFRLFKRLGDAVEADDARYYHTLGGAESQVFTVPMDMTAHDTLDGIMIDRALPAPGSLQEKANQAFLPAGYTFVHDRHGFCALDVIKLPA